MKSLASIKTEIKQDLSWHLGWIIGINAYVLLSIFIYPGKEGLQDLLGLLQDEYFQAFLGNIGGESPSYSLWISLMVGFLGLAYFLYGMLTGSRTTSKAIDDGVGEIVHIYPLNRLTIFAYRWIAAILMFMLNLIVLITLLSIPFMGETVPFENLIPTALWGLLFTVSAMGVGMFLTVLAGQTGKGQQVGLLVTLILYSLQIFAYLQENAKFLLEINIIMWFNPSDAILGRDVEIDYIVKLAAVLVVFTLLSFYLYNKRDLIKGRGFEIPFISSVSLPQFLQRSEKTKSEKNSIFTSWVRPLEKKLPFTANFVYSERRVILIVFIGILLIWPFQLMAYPLTKDTLDTEALGSFGGILELFTYGHDISDLYLWFIVTQAIGNHYFFFVPLIFYWTGKVIRREGETKTGEIMGSIPVEPYKVLLQRLIAIFLEIVLFTLLMVASLLISELVISESYNKIWEVIAVLSYIPLYLFLMTALFSIALLFKDEGVKIARIILLTLIFIFAASIITNQFTWILPFTVFGLFDPVLIMMEGSLSVRNYGVIILTGLSIITTITIYLLSPRYTWLNIKEHPMKKVDKLSTIKDQKQITS